MVFIDAALKQNEQVGECAPQLSERVRVQRTRVEGFDLLVHVSKFVSYTGIHRGQRSQQKGMSDPQVVRSFIALPGVRSRPVLTCGPTALLQHGASLENPDSSR